MQITFEKESAHPWSLYRGDLRMDGFINPVTMSTLNQFSIYESEIAPPPVPANFLGSSYNNHPKLSWSLNSEPDMVSYEVWRVIFPSGGTGSYSLIATLNKTISSFIDYEIELGGPSQGKVFYKVRAKDIGLNYSQFTNEIRYSYSGINKIIAEPLAYINTLKSNYPNPFNPSTVINYSVKEAGLVKLKVYDILGSEVAELVNETKEEGYHSVEFNASNLPSGVYIYALQVNGFTSSKKMLLMK